MPRPHGRGVLIPLSQGSRRGPRPADASGRAEPGRSLPLPGATPSSGRASLGTRPGRLRARREFPGTRPGNCAGMTPGSVCAQTIAAPRATTPSNACVIAHTFRRLGFRRLAYRVGKSIPDTMRPDDQDFIHAPDDGLTHGLREVDRIRSIVSPSAAVAAVSLSTRRMKRYMRKDFYFVSRQLFFARGEASRLGSYALIDAEAAVSELETVIAGMGATSLWTHGRERYVVRLLHPRCARLLRVVRRIDVCGGRLLALELDGGISRRERNEILRPAVQALEAVKRSLLNGTSNPEQRFGLTARADP